MRNQWRQLVIPFSHGLSRYHGLWANVVTCNRWLGRCACLLCNYLDYLGEGSRQGRRESAPRDGLPVELRENDMGSGADKVYVDLCITGIAFR